MSKGHVLVGKYPGGKCPGGEVSRGMSGGTCPGGGGRSTCIINIVGNADYKCYYEFAVKRSFPDETLPRSPSAELQKGYTQI